jgi:hypothetical protein
MPATDEDMLRDLLHASTDDLVLAPGRGRAIVTRRRRQRAARGLLAGVPAIGAVAGGLAVAAHSGSTPATTAHRPSTETAAYVTRQVEAALGNAGSYIIETTGTQPGGATFTADTDPVTFSSRQTVIAASGRSITWSRAGDAANTLHWHNTLVDYHSRTWFPVNLQAAAPMAGGPPTSGTDVQGGVPAQIKQDIEDGRLTIVGHGEINGHNAIELQSVTKKDAVTKIWADAQTCQPVRMITGGAGAGKVTNIAWIRKSPALVQAVNNPQIPAGFTHVAPPSPGKK